MEPDLTSPEPGRRPHIREVRPLPGKAHLTLLNTTPWAHTLLLTGELNHRSAPALEEEIEGLCQEGVQALRLDLRSLEGIDAAGIAVIAFRSQECIRLGCDFDVIAEAPALRHALSDAGVALARSEPERQATPKLVGAAGDKPEPAAAVESGPPAPRRGRLSRWRPGA